jgi:hypothetical protein
MRSKPIIIMRGGRRPMSAGITSQNDALPLE